MSYIRVGDSNTRIRCGIGCNPSYIYEYLFLAIAVFRWVVEKTVFLVGVSPHIFGIMMLIAVLVVVGEKNLAKIHSVAGEELPDLVAKVNLFHNLSLSLPHRA